MLARTSAEEVYVTRRAKEALHPNCLVLKYKDFSSCIVQGIISISANGPLVFFKKEQCTNAKGSVNLEVYICYILPLVYTFQEDYQRREIVRVETSSNKMYRDFIYIKDNYSVHNSKATTAAFQALGINKLQQLANSLDLNPIKNVQQLLKQQLAKRFPKTNAEVKQYLKEEQDKIKVNNYKKYITSMQDRCQAVIKAGSGHTKQ